MQPSFFIRTDNRYTKIIFKDILYAECRKNYVQIVMEGGKSHMVLISMNQLEGTLPKQFFCRVHRSYLVSLNHVTSFNNDTIYIKDLPIPICGEYKELLHRSVHILVSETRCKKPTIVNKNGELEP